MNLGPQPLTDHSNELASAALDTFKHEYEDLCSTWTHVETKAQGTATICGVFIAGILAFLREMPVNTFNLQLIRIAITCTLALLGLCVLTCVFVLRVREVSAAPIGTALITMLNDLLKVDMRDSVTWRNFLVDQARMWRSVNEEIRQANLTKAAWLHRSQCLLLLGMGCAVGSILLKVWS